MQPSLKSMEIHYENKHPKESWADALKIYDKQEEGQSQNQAQDDNNYEDEDNEEEVNEEEEKEKNRKLVEEILNEITINYLTNNSIHPYGGSNTPEKSAQKEKERNKILSEFMSKREKLNNPNT